MNRIFKIYQNQQHFFLGFTGALIFLTIWEIITRTKIINPIFLSPPTEILQTEWILFTSGKIFPHLFISLQEFSLGFAIAIILGVSLGLLIGWYKKIEALTSSLIYSLYSTPNIALLPLIIIWTGLGIWSKIIVVFLGAFFPILINTIAGVKNLDPNLVSLARSFGATESQIFKTIIFPASLPYILTGFKLAIPRAMIGMIIGEFFVSNQGLGYLITFYGSTFQTAEILAVVVIVVIISVSLTKLLSYLEKHFQSWKV
ncbi:MAG: ABC transporter permease [Candidatus Daviesbacteria bacterium]|nr:ABC transporter permease [Candidatus Daviesbacteria bacterium]